MKMKLVVPCDEDDYGDTDIWHSLTAASHQFRQFLLFRHFRRGCSMKILFTSRHLQPISRKDKRKLVTDIVILKLFTSYGECERFSAKKWLKK